MTPVELLYDRFFSVLFLSLKVQMYFLFSNTQKGSLEKKRVASILFFLICVAFQCRGREDVPNNLYNVSAFAILDLPKDVFTSSLTVNIIMIYIINKNDF